MAHRYKYKPSGVKISLDRKKILIISILIAAGVAVFLLAKFYPWPTNVAVYRNIFLEFDVNLRETKRIAVIPDEDAVKSLMFYPSIRKVTLVYNLEASGADYGIMSTGVFDVANKLKLVYLSNDMDVGFGVMNVTSFENLQSNESNVNVIFVTPSMADGTYVKVADKNVFVSGADREGFNLAVVKFILSAIGYKI